MKRTAENVCAFSKLSNFFSQAIELFLFGIDD